MGVHELQGVGGDGGSSQASGALVTTRGWDWLHLGSLMPLTLRALGLARLPRPRQTVTA